MLSARNTHQITEGSASYLRAPTPVHSARVGTAFSETNLRTLPAPPDKRVNRGAGESTRVANSRRSQLFRQFSRPSGSNPGKKASSNLENHKR